MYKLLITCIDLFFAALDSAVLKLFFLVFAKLQIYYIYFIFSTSIY